MRSAVLSPTASIRLSPRLSAFSYDVATTVRNALSIAPDRQLPTRYAEPGPTHVAS